MVAIGSCLFCDMCGALLDKKMVLHGQTRPLVECHQCQAMNEDTSQQVIITKSRPDAFPSALRDKRAQVQKLTAEQRQNTRARTEQECTKCGKDEVWYHTQQLRGADEGSTVFYECDCGNKWVMNN